MAKAKRSPYSAKITMWTPDIRLETGGGAVGCIRAMFDLLPLDKQENTLNFLKEAHDEKQRQSPPIAESGPLDL